MSATVGALNVVLSADTARFSQGLKAAQGQLATFGQSANRATGNVTAIGSAFTRNRGAIQNAAFQFQDIAVQMQMGTAASRALAIQLPQLLGGFGALGAVIGLGVGVSLPMLADAFARSGGAAEDLGKAIAGTQSAMSAAEGVVRALRDAQAAYAQAILDSGNAQNAVTPAIVAQAEREFIAKRELVRIETERLRIQLALNKAQLGTASAALRAEIADRGAVGLNIRRDTDFADRGARPTPPTAAQLPFESQQIIGDFFNLSDAQKQRQLEVRELRVEVDALEQTLRSVEKASEDAFTPIARVVEEIRLDGAAAGGGGGGGGSGGRAAPKTKFGVAEQEAAALSIRINDLVQQAETERLAEQAQRLASAWEMVNRGLADAFTDAIVGARSLESALGDVLTQLGRMLINQAFLSVLGASGIGGALGLTIPGFANGTRFAPGGLSLVGERGPELVNLPRGAQVIPNHALGGGAVDVRVYVDEGGNWQAAVERISGGVAARVSQQAVGAYDRGLPGRMDAIRNDPWRRG